MLGFTNRVAKMCYAVAFSRRSLHRGC